MRLTHRILITSVFITAVVVAMALLIVDRRTATRLAANPAIPAAVADELRERIHRDFLIGGVLTLLVGVGLAIRITRPVVRPIEELRDIARSMAAGDLTTRPPRSIRGGEVGDLADALRQMAEQLDARFWELQSEEALLVALTESLNEGVIAVDVRKRVVRINETGRQLLRLRQPVPFPASDLPAIPMLHEALQLVLSGSSPIFREVRFDDRTVQLTARPLRGGGAIVALFDLTPVRRLEAVRQDFVANVSHELRTPLTVIGGFVETLQDEELPPDLRRQFLGMVASNVGRMQRIVDDLLDLSRIESGGWVPAPELLNVPDVAAEVFAPLQRTALQKQVALVTQIGADATLLHADPTALRQILGNLAQNALRHTTTGEVTLFCRTADNGYQVGVRDTGCGIAPEHHSRLFERFYRVDPGRSREAGGTGLGLAIVKHLTEAHGGRVQVESEVGVGTTITAWLPASRRAG
jgi:signal transduction histidine kinase